MAIAVDINDRLYDYTDEEAAAAVIEDFQALNNLDDKAILAIWQDEAHPRHRELYDRVLFAIDSNGTVKRAEVAIPANIDLQIA